MATRAITSKELGPPLGMYSHEMVVPAYHPDEVDPANTLSRRRPAGRKRR